jgi:hypothetical protein
MNNIVLIVGHAVAQWLKHCAKRLEGRGIDSQWCHWNLSLT